MHIDERIRLGADALRREPISADDRASARASVARRQSRRRRRRHTALSAAAVAAVLVGVATAARDDPRHVETGGGEHRSGLESPTTDPAPETTTPATTGPTTTGPERGPTSTTPSTTAASTSPAPSRPPATAAGPTTTVRPTTDPNETAPETTTTAATTPPTTVDPSLPFPLLAPGVLPPPLPGVVDPQWSTRASQWAWTRPEAYAIRVHVVWMGTAAGPYDVVVRGRGAAESVTVTDPYTGAPVDPATPFVTIDAIYGYVVTEFGAALTIATGVGAEAVPAEAVATYPDGDPLAHVTISAFAVLG